MLSRRPVSSRYISYLTNSTTVQQQLRFKTTLTTNTQSNDCTTRQSIINHALPLNNPLAPKSNPSKPPTMLLVPIMHLLTAALGFLILYSLYAPSVIPSPYEIYPNHFETILCSSSPTCRHCSHPRRRLSMFPPRTFSDLSSRAWLSR